MILTTNNSESGHFGVNRLVEGYSLLDFVGVGHCFAILLSYCSRENSGTKRGVFIAESKLQ